MRFDLKKTLAGVAAIAVLATVAPFVGSSAASAATNNGAVTLTPLTGNSGTNITFGFPATPTCPGDTATGLYNWASFLVPAASDIDTDLQFDAGGPVARRLPGYRTPLARHGRQRRWSTRPRR